MRWERTVYTAIFVIALAAAATPASADVNVLRGSISDTVAVDQSGPLPAEVRGSAGLTPVPKAKTRAVARPIVYRPWMAAGGVLWLIGGKGRLTACHLQGSEYAGRQRIVCTGGR